MDYQNPLSQAAQTYYRAGLENSRLTSSSGRLEAERSRQLLKRYLPVPPAAILDVGGGTGPYSFWLAQLGYQVHLIDAMPLHIEQARQNALNQLTAPLANLALGDARRLPQADNSMDVVLLMGPLYHLTERVDRLGAWQEAYRVLRQGGLVIGVGISRYASLLDGMFGGLLADSTFVEIVKQDLSDGKHRNPTSNPAYFTTAYFHHSDELKGEMVEAGFEHKQTLPVEGPAWLSQYVESSWEDEAKRQVVLQLLDQIENEPNLLGVSCHIMSVGRKV